LKDCPKDITIEAEVELNEDDKEPKKRGGTSN
jgi:hypothetical protein